MLFRGQILLRLGNFEGLASRSKEDVSATPFLLVFQFICSWLKVSEVKKLQKREGRGKGRQGRTNLAGQTLESLLRNIKGGGREMSTRVSFKSC